jgi:hypothetical protein
MRPCFLLAGLSTLGLLGCGGSGFSILHFYPGPRLPDASVGMLSFTIGQADNAKVRLVALDGAKSDDLAECRRGEGCVIGLQPGSHTLTFVYNDMICDMKDTGGQCSRGIRYYVAPIAHLNERMSAADGVMTAPLGHCTVVPPGSSTVPLLGVLAGAVVDVAVQAKREADLQEVCTSAMESKERTLTFPTTAGKYYAASFSASGAELRVTIEPSTDPNAPPVKE